MFKFLVELVGHNVCRIHCWHVLHSLHTNEWSKRKTLTPHFSVCQWKFSLSFFSGPHRPHTTLVHKQRNNVHTWYTWFSGCRRGGCERIVGMAADERWPGFSKLFSIIAAYICALCCFKKAYPFLRSEPTTL